LADLLAHGIPPALGTDGGCSNNRASIYDEMRTLALLHKGLHQDATVVTHRQVLEFGTKQGAEHLDIPAGDLQPGRLADFVGIDLNHPSLIPWTVETLPANMVYAMQPEAIREVVVGGRQVVHEGVLTTIDQQRLGTQVQALVQHWFQ
jgi:5-methylthioadenosine/S-adenosylhomocysteine deaminase